MLLLALIITGCGVNDDERPKDAGGEGAADSHRADGMSTPGDGGDAWDLSPHPLDDGAGIDVPWLPHDDAGGADVVPHPQDDGGQLDIAADLAMDGGAPDAAADAGPAPGTRIWHALYREKGEVFSLVTTRDGQGNSYVAGAFAGQLKLVYPTSEVAVGARDAFVAKVDALGQLVWVETFGGDGDDAITAVGVDSQGAVTVAGHFQGTVDLGKGAKTASGASDTFLLRLDASGQLLWVRAFAGSQDERVSALRVEAGGRVLLAGTFDGSVDLGGGAVLTSTGSRDTFLAAFNGATGATLWRAQHGSSGSLVWNAIATDSVGNITLAGAFSGALALGSATLNAQGTRDALLVGLSAARQLRWSRRVGSAGADSAVAVVVDAAGNSYFTGHVVGQADFGGGSATLKGQDLFVASYAADGAYRWAKTFGSTGSDDRGKALSVDPSSGHVLVAGEFSGALLFGSTAVYGQGIDVLMGELDPSGQAVAVRAWGKAGDDHGYGVAVDAAGGYTLSGRFEGSIAFGAYSLSAVAEPEFFVASFAKGHSPRWARQIAAELRPVVARGVSTNSSGDVVVYGGFAGTMRYETSRFISAGGEDGFVSTFDQNGVHRWTKHLGNSGTEKVAGAVIDASGVVTMAGTFTNQLSVGSGPYLPDPRGIFLGRTDKTSTHLWSASFAASLRETCRAVVQDSAGNITLVGTFAGSLNFGSGAQTALSAPQEDAIYIASFDDMGAHRWSKRFLSASGAKAAEVSGLAVDGQGNIFIVGAFDTSIDLGGSVLTASGAGAYVASYDVNGQHRWSKPLTTQPAAPRAIAASTAGEVVVVGSFGGTVDFGGGGRTAVGRDIFTVRLDASGAHRWSKRLGGPADDGAEAVALDALGRILVSGAFSGSVDFGGGALQARGPSDGFALALTAGGGYRWAVHLGGVDGAAASRDVVYGIAPAPGAFYLGGQLVGPTDLGNGSGTLPLRQGAFLGKYRD